jgi:hypothetical protein
VWAALFGWGAIISMPSFLIERIIVIGTMANQILWLGFDHVEVGA